MFNVSLTYKLSDNTYWIYSNYVCKKKENLQKTETEI